MRGQLGRTIVQGALRSPSTRPISHSFPLTSRQLLGRSPLAHAHAQPVRYASSDLAAEVAHQERIGNARSGLTRFKNLVYGTVLLLTGSFVYLYVSDTRSGIHQYLVPRLIRTAFPDAEDAHHFGNNALKATYAFGVHPRERGNPDAKGDLRVEVFGHVLDNPIGTSAGLDKNAEVVDPVFALGPGLVEVGGITPRPQQGNAKPRVWRVPSQNALINRYGLNSEGADSVAVRLRQRLRQFAYDLGLGLDPEAERQVLDGEIGVPPGSHIPGRLLAVQVAKMKDTPDNDIDAIARDYTDAVDKLAKYADILVVNVSSPNTPGLRALQASEPLTKILSAVVDSAKLATRKTKPAVMVKVSPDEDSEEQVRGICAAVWASGVDGVIVGNTTKTRPDPLPRGYLLPSHEEQIMLEMGGYSGPQLFDRTVSLVKKYRAALDQGPQEAAPSPSKSKSPAQASAPSPAQEKSSSDLKPADNDDDSPTFAEKVSASLERDVERLKPLSSDAGAEAKQPLVRLPERHTTDNNDLQAAEPALSASTHTAQGSSPPASSAASSSSPLSSSSSSSSSSSASTSAPSIAPSAVPDAAQHKEKVIFATGGVTNGKQALEVLNAGASVAFVYTALVYGGAGTVSRIKKEMRDEIRNK